MDWYVIEQECKNKRVILNSKFSVIKNEELTLP